MGSLTRTLKSILSSVFPFKISIRRRKGRGHKYDPRFVESKNRIRDDEYIHWICVVTGGWLSEGDGNLVAFDYAIKNMPDQGSVVEIGSFLGLSTNILIYLMSNHGRKHALFNCDPWEFEATEEPIGGYFDAARKEYRDYSKDTFISNMRVFCRDHLPYSIEAFSDDFFVEWDQAKEVEDLFGRRAKLGGDISFAYIDGAHTYEASKRDFENVDRHLVEGGFVLLDDSGDNGLFESSRAGRSERPEIRADLQSTQLPVSQDLNGTAYRLVI